MEQAVLLGPFFGAGWLILAAPFIRRLYAPGEPDRHELVGCVLSAAGALACLWLVGSVLVG